MYEIAAAGKQVSNGNGHWAIAYPRQLSLEAVQVQFANDPLDLLIAHSTTPSYNASVQ